MTNLLRKRKKKKTHFLRKLKFIYLVEIIKYWTLINNPTSVHPKSEARRAKNPEISHQLKTKNKINSNRKQFEIHYVKIL